MELEEFNVLRKERMCTGKKSYSKKDAQTAVNARRGRSMGRGRPNKNVRMYQCPLCNKWHLTDREPVNNYVKYTRKRIY